MPHVPADGELAHIESNAGAARTEQLALDGERFRLAILRLGRAADHCEQRNGEEARCRYGSTVPIAINARSAISSGPTASL